MTKVVREAGIAAGARRIGVRASPKTRVASGSVSRELAPVSMLSALPGAESRLQSHMRISMNVGLTASQLRQLTQDNARRAREALERQLATKSGG